MYDVRWKTYAHFFQGVRVLTTPPLGGFCPSGNEGIEGSIKTIEVGEGLYKKSGFASIILSFLLVTSAIKNLGSNLVSTGKLATPEIREFLKKSKLGKKVIGDTKFNIEKLNKGKTQNLQLWVKLNIENLIKF